MILHLSSPVVAVGGW